MECLQTPISVDQGQWVINMKLSFEMLTKSLLRLVSSLPHYVSGSQNCEQNTGEYYQFLNDIFHRLEPLGLSSAISTVQTLQMGVEDKRKLNAS